MQTITQRIARKRAHRQRFRQTDRVPERKGHGRIDQRESSSAEIPRRRSLPRSLFSARWSLSRHRLQPSGAKLDSSQHTVFDIPTTTRSCRSSNKKQITYGNNYVGRTAFVRKFPTVARKNEVKSRTGLIFYEVRVNISREESWWVLLKFSIRKEFAEHKAFLHHRSS